MSPKPGGRRASIPSFADLSRRREDIAIRFNAVSSPFYDPFLEAFRAAKEKRHISSNPSADDELEDMALIDYKYYTFPLAALAGRRPRAKFYHPFAIVDTKLFRPRAIGSFFLIYADGLIYVFSEEEPIRSPRSVDYSMVIAYIPIEGCVLRAEDRIDTAYSWFDFSIHGHGVRRIPIANEYRLAFLEFVRNCGLEIGPVPRGSA
ncbi:MAG TPA: hypothetical protein VIO60_08150 [Rectinemataceae bacterium]